MKKRICALLCLAVLLALAGCGSGGAAGKTMKKSTGVGDVLEQGMAEAAGGKTEETAGSDLRPEGGAGDKKDPEPVIGQEEVPDSIDVDLTVLSSTMVYSEVYNMMESPEEYIGKTIKMDGLFAYYHDEATDNYYFACVIQDATACCSQGIEFVLAGDHAYPEDYPEVNEEICVVGVFDTYREGSYTYCTLRNAALV